MSSSKKNNQNITTENAVKSTEKVTVPVEEVGTIKAKTIETESVVTETKKNNTGELRTGLRVKINPNITKDANGNELDKNLLLGSFLITNIADGRVSLARMLGVAASVAVNENDVIL